MSYRLGSEGVSGEPSRRQVPRLMDEVRRRIRLKHYSLRTEQAYTGWIRRFILANGRRHPRELGATDVERFLSGLAVQGGVAASTQNQALSALLFLYREVLRLDLPWLQGVVRAKSSRRLPTVLSQDEMRRLLALMDGRAWLIASLLYGTGMRLMECLRLRVKDVDFSRNEIVVRDGKGGKDRRTVLPRALHEPLLREIARARLLHERDLADGVVRRGCHMRWRASIRMRRASLAGNSSFHRPAAPPIRWTGANDATISTTRSWRAFCGERQRRRRSSSRCMRMHCVTASPPTCWKRVTTCARSRNCWGTRM